MQVSTEHHYTFGNSGNTQEWFIINDGVMGGLSKGQLTFTDSTTVFAGTVSLDNNGGFTAYRSPYGQYDLSAYSTVTIRARGQGQVIGFSLQMEQPYYAPYFRSTFVPQEDWREYSFDLTDMPALRLGRNLGYTMSKADLAEVIRLGFITTEKAAGPFVLEIESVRFS